MIKFEIQKKKFQQILKTHSEYAACYGLSNILIGIHVVVKGDIISFYSTDGIRLLKTQFKLNKKYKTFKATYNSETLSRLKFIKGNINSCIDNLEISISKKEMIIFDMCNKFTYKIPSMNEENRVPYPKVEELLKEPENAYKFALNVDYLSYLKNLSVNPRLKIMQISVDKENNLSPIYFKAENESEEMLQECIIMPIQIKE